MPPYAPLSVLVVDDEPTNRLFLLALLKRLGHVATEAVDGATGLAAFRAAPPDIVLLDLMMPGMDGFELTRAIRSTETASHTPLVVLSALDDVDAIVRAIECGADDYLTKPIRVPILTAKLNHFADIVAARKARRAESERARAIGDTVPDALVVIDGNGIIEWCNPATGRLFGYPAETLPGRNVSMLMPEPLRSEHDGYIARFLAGGEPRVIGARRRVFGERANGSVVPLELVVAPLEAGDRPRFLGMLRDMTDAEQLERLKQEFISMVNHELRTPLTSIVGSLSLLASGAAGQLPAAAHKMVALAERNTARLGRLINDILDLDKIESGALKMTIEPADALLLLREAISLSGELAGGRGITLTLDAGELAEDSPWLRVDRDRFQQVLGNLLSNAIKFSPDGSTVTVRASRHGNHLRISVIDRGAGIPPEFRSRIFQRFAQHESAANRRQQGSGLGLSIARAIVLQMGGEIGFASEVDRGSEFFVNLPLSAAEGDAGEHAP
jgi:PAS domain S-box-containing protein